MDIRHFKAQGYSFVRFDNKDAATRAITEMNGHELNDQAIKCSWGKSEVYKKKFFFDIYFMYFLGCEW